ncbi:senescence-associated protein-domain-containing protein [Paraphysoderma sedebokerense]|nr:senescence-associated protein-domain-containing protein [Paraphysoderma sedebokerense]KAI9137195.1 senescence-associated protein-domain-containing protein [Paraphysoderma sedebokerense]
MVASSISYSASPKSKPEAFQLNLDAQTRVFKQGESCFLFPSMNEPGVMYRVELVRPAPDNLETFQDLLQHYTTFSLPNESMKNTLALVNNRGEIVGKLAQNVKFEETDQVRSMEGSDVTPVVLQMPEGLQELMQKAKTADYTPVITVAAATSSAMVRHSETLSKYMIQGAEMVGAGIESASQQVKSQIKPNQAPLTFTPETKAKVQTVKQMSEVAVKASSMAGTAAALFATSVGTAIAQKIKQNKTIGGKNTNTALKATTETLKALATVFDAVSDSTRIIVKSTTSSAVDLINHKYGAEAGEVASELAGVTENLTLVYFDTKGLRRKAMMKGVVKGTVKELAGKKNAAQIGVEEDDDASHANMMPMMLGNQMLMGALMNGNNGNGNGNHLTNGNTKAKLGK